MATHDYVIANGTGAAVRSDLNDALAAIVSNNSSSSEPATTYAYQWWADTTANVLKIRNSANNAWITLRELDGTLLMEDGSASTPGLAFADDTDTGIFSGGSDQVGLSTNGVERFNVGTGSVIVNDPGNDVDFRVESNGNTHMLFVDAGNNRVGVGESTPATDLEITASAPEVRISSSNTGQTSGSSVGKLSFYTSDSTTPGGAGVAASIETLSSTSNGSDYQLLINKREGSGGGSCFINLGSSSTGAISFGTATSGTGSEKVRIDSSGRVGIGLSSNITSLLHVESSFAGTLAEIKNTRGSASTDAGLLVETSTTAAKTLVVQNAGTERFSVQGDGTGYLNGSLGIGTASPGFKLHCVEDGSAAAICASSNVTADALASRLALGNSVGTARFTVNMKGGGSELAYLGSEGNFPFYFQTNGAERLRIDASGRLLVGTSTAREHLNDGSDSAQVFIQGTTQNTSTLAVIRSSDNDGPSHFVLGKARGTGSGSTTIVQDGDTIGSINFEGADGTHLIRAGQISCVVDGGPGANDMPGSLKFSTTANGSNSLTQRMRISNQGRLDIFASSATDSHFISSGASAGTITDLITGKHSATAITNANNGTTSFAVRTNGNVVNTNNSYGSLSDVKLKENIADASSQWDDIKGLRVRNYNFKEETGNPTHTQIGVVAQEVETVSPGLVYETPDRDSEGTDLGTVTKSVNYSVLYMKAVKALQEAMTRIETLEAKVAALEAG